MELSLSAPFLAAHWPTILSCLITGFTLFIATKILKQLGVNSKVHEKPTLVDKTGILQPGDTENDDKEDEDNGAAGYPPDEEHQEHIPYKPSRFNEDDMINRSKQFYEFMNQRRSVRFVSSEKFPLDIVKNLIKTAGI